MKDQLDHKIQLCEDAMKNLDLNTRLQSKKKCFRCEDSEAVKYNIGSH